MRTCPLCRRRLDPTERTERFARLDLCLERFDGQRQSLEARGFLIRESMVRRNQDRYHRRLEGTLPGATGIRASLTEETWLDRLARLYKPDLQIGDEIFDGRVLIQTTTPSRLERVLQLEGLQDAILETLTQIFEISIEDDRIVLEYADKRLPAPPEPGVARRYMAVLLHWLEEARSQELVY